MRYLIKLLAVFSVVTVFGTASYAADKTVTLSTLDWPPYTDSKLPDHGFTSLVVKKAFNAVGYKVKIKFYPWKRAVRMATTPGTPVMGVFPEYSGGCAGHKGLESGLIGRGPLGFVEKKTVQHNWSQLSDLKGQEIGTVLGYANTPQFDQMAKEGKLKVFPVKDDMTNLKKVAKGRLGLAVIDANVFKFMQSQDPALKSLQINAKLLSEGIGLHLCFKNNDKGKQLRALFDQGLKQVDIQKTVQEYLNKL